MTSGNNSVHLHNIGDLSRHPNAGQPPRPSQKKCLQRGRFALGLVLSTIGVGTILMVAVGSLQQVGVRGQISMPIVGLCIIGGVMLLGGGFGLMATAAAGFDEDEFERLMIAGDARLNADEDLQQANTGTSTASPIGDHEQISA